MEKLRILVCGGRHFEDYDFLKRVLENVLKEKMLTPKDVEIVSGHSKGADSLGERWAEENNASVKIFPADWVKYKKSAGPIRNKQMIDYINCFENKMVVAFVSPNSKGTKQTISLAEKNKIPVIITEYGTLEIIENKKHNNLHNEMHQIIVSKKELYWQLRNFDIQDNLFDFFTTDTNNPEYTRLLNLLGVKLELVGAFNYISKVGGERHLVKPPISTYYRYIFDNYCESADEVGLKIYAYSPEYREMLFKKYRAVRYYITPMLVATSEQNYTAIFMGILDYVAKNDDFPETSFSSITGFPEVLREKVKNFDWWSNDVHR